MATPLHVLIIEDSGDDALLITRELQRGGYAPRSERVETEKALTAALDRGPWDVVVSDFRMPAFSGTDALKVLRARDPDTPFIFVSGTIGEDVAVEAMRAGAQDYVTKGNLRRLVPAIERELRDAATRRERRVAEVRFRRMVDSAMMGILFWDPAGQIRDANDEFLKIVGYTREDLRAGRLDWPAMTPPEYEALDAAARRDLVVTGTCTPYEKEYLRKDGSRVPVLVGGALLDEPEHFGVAFVLDITERQRSADAVRASEAQLRAILRAALDAHVTMDDTGTITGWNPQAEATFGWTEAEALGRPLADVVLPLADRDRHRRGLEHFLATGEGPILNQRLELEALRRDGREFPVELAVAPIRLRDRWTFSAFLRDITERRTAEDALRRSEERYRLLFDSGPHPMWVYDPDTLRFLTVNDAATRRYGYAREEFLTMSLGDLLPPARRRVAARALPRRWRRAARSPPACGSIRRRTARSSTWTWCATRCSSRDDPPCSSWPRTSPSAAAWSGSCSTPRRWTPSAGSRAASPTTSTTS